jgi:hypothetical protein
LYFDLNMRETIVALVPITATNTRKVTKYRSIKMWVFSNIDPNEILVTPIGLERAVQLLSGIEYELSGDLHDSGHIKTAQVFWRCFHFLNFFPVSQNKFRNDINFVVLFEVLQRSPL